MGYWGDGLFENDYDFDRISDLSYDIGVELLMYEDEAEREAARQALNSGIYTATYKRLHDDGKISHKELILFVACAMTLGVKIDDTSKPELKRICNLRSLGLLPKSKKQFKDSLKGYKNDGTPWEFDSYGLVETANMMAAEEEAKKGAERAPGDKPAVDGAQGASKKRSGDPASGISKKAKTDANAAKKTNTKAKAPAKKTKKAKAAVARDN